MSIPEFIATKNRIITQQTLIIAIAVLMFLGSSVWSLTSVILEGMLYFIGICFVSIGIIGRAWCLSYIAGRKNMRLITSGPYSICRNPLYFFNSIATIGVGLCTKTFSVPLVLLLLFLIVYPVTIKFEEKKLMQRFGASYEEYCLRTPRFLPSPSSYSDSYFTTIETKPFRNGIIDLIPLLLILGLFEVFEALHKANVISTNFLIY